MRLVFVFVALQFLFCVRCLENDHGFVGGRGDIPYNSGAKVVIKRQISVANWNPYSAWGPCSKTCGGGIQERTRTCNAVAGQSCPGPAKETKPCNVQPCLGKWAAWGVWSSCSVTCGSGGKQSRKRVCIGGSCVGPSEETRPCSGPKPCDQGRWGEWGQWSPCSKTCGGGGEQSRLRQCINGIEGSPGCPGQAKETRPCSGPKPCQGSWGQWGVWSPCSVTCGSGGKQSRKRVCNGGGCVGPSEETRPCSGPKPCDQGRWGEWSQWTPCSKSCGGGSQTRQRQCINGKEGAPGCYGSAKEKRTCNLQACPK